MGHVSCDFELNFELHFNRHTVRFYRDTHPVRCVRYIIIIIIIISSRAAT